AASPFARRSFTSFICAAVSLGFLASASSISFMSFGQWNANAVVEANSAAAASARMRFIRCSPRGRLTKSAAPESALAPPGASTTGCKAAEVEERVSLEPPRGLGAQDVGRDVLGRAQLSLGLHAPETLDVGKIALRGAA